MKKAVLFLSIFSFIALLSTNVSAQKLSKFGGTTQKQVGPKTIRVPYTDVISYLGYAQTGQEDAVVENKKFYYIYIWIPLAAPELGIRMMSPVGSDYKNKKAIQSDGYKANSTSEEFFDTYITLERSNIIAADKISEEAVKSAKWVVLDRNDDSSEMPKQPSGSSYNSLLRYKSEMSDPLKALTAGLYRVGFTTYKLGDVKGTFLAEVGAPIKLPGIVMDKTIDGILKGIKK